MTVAAGGTRRGRHTPKVHVTNGRASPQPRLLQMGERFHNPLAPKEVDCRLCPGHTYAALPATTSLGRTALPYRDRVATKATAVTPAPRAALTIRLGHLGRNRTPSIRQSATVSTLAR